MGWFGHLKRMGQDEMIRKIISYKSEVNDVDTRELVDIMSRAFEKRERTGICMDEQVQAPAAATPTGGSKEVIRIGKLHNIMMPLNMFHSLQYFNLNDTKYHSNKTYLDAQQELMITIVSESLPETCVFYHYVDDIRHIMTKLIHRFLTIKL